MCKLLKESCHTDEACSHFWPKKKPKEVKVISKKNKIDTCEPFTGIRKIPMNNIVIKGRFEPVFSG
jgi:hypothetical protein